MIERLCSRGGYGGEYTMLIVDIPFDDYERESTIRQEPVRGC